MAQGLKRKTLESECDMSENSIQFYQQRAHLLQLTISKFSSLYNDFHKSALLRSTMRRYRKEREEEDAAEQMFQDDSPLQETSWEDTPRSCTPGPAELFMDSGKDYPSTSEAWETDVSDVGYTTCPTSIFSGQPGGQSSSEDPECESSSAALQEILHSTEDLQMDPGQGNKQCLEEPASPKSDGSIASSSEDPTPIFQLETRICDSFSPEEQLNDPMSENTEVLVANYLSDLSVDDYFAEIDTSEFEAVSAPQPRGRETTPIYAVQEACENLLHFPAQGANGIDDLEQFAMLMLVSK